MARLKHVQGWNEYSKDLKKAGTRWTIRKKSNNPYIYVRDKDTNKTITIVTQRCMIYGHRGVEQSGSSSGS